MILPRFDSSDLKDRIDLRDVVRDFWGEPDRQSNRYDQYFSRWRDDGSKPSFTVYATHYRDYGGTGDSGDVFSFLQQELNFDFRAAVEWVSSYCGAGIQTSDQTKRPALPRHSIQADEPPSPEWQQAAQDALKQAQSYLWSNRQDAMQVRHYLNTVRGLSDETIQQFGYGYNPAWHTVDYIDPDTNKAPYLAPGIIEPWFYAGTLWALRIRCRVGNLADALGIPSEIGRDGEELPKYLNLAGSKQSGALFNGDSIKPGEDVLIVEGGFDAALAQQTLNQGLIVSGDLMHQIPTDNTMYSITVVTAGSASTPIHSERLEHLKQSGRVFLLLDSDEAGQNAQRKFITALGDKAVPLSLPQGHGKDVTDFIVNHQGDLQALLAQAISPAWWREGVPDSIRSALLNYFPARCAPVIEMVNEALHYGLITGTGFTINELLNANTRLNYHIKAATIRRAVEDLEGVFFAKVDTDLSTVESVSRNAKNVGRKGEIYCMLPLDHIRIGIIAWAKPRIYEQCHPIGFEEGKEASGIVAKPLPAMFEAVGINSESARWSSEQISQRLEDVFQVQNYAEQDAGKRAIARLAQLKNALQDRTSTPLPEGWPLSSTKEYRAAFLRATNNPQQRRSRRQIRNLIGISNAALDSVVRQAGLARQDKQGEYELRRLRHAENLEFQINREARVVQGFPRSLVIHTPDGAVIEQGYMGSDSGEIVKAHIQNGAKVYVRLQVANHYIEVSDTPLQATPETRQAQNGGRESEKSAQDSTKSHDTEHPRPIQKSHRHYGPTFDPTWVMAQMKLALHRKGVLRLHGSDQWINTETGEVLTAPSATYLLQLLLIS